MGRRDMTLSATLAPIIQGGMGAAVSDWRLANAVARAGQLGVVSGTGIDTVFCRRLQDGDVGRHLHRAMESFPLRGAAEQALRKSSRTSGGDGESPWARPRSSRICWGQPSRYAPACVPIS
jgi:nitronate monooxygenase